MVSLASSPKGGALPPHVGSAGARLAQRVEDALAKTLTKEPKQIDPKKILVSQYNRMGAPPNVQYVHKTLLRSFLEKGYDYSRPAVGICVEIKSPEGKKKLLEHNKKFTSPLMPPLLEDGVQYASIASSHLNASLRFLVSGKSSPVGDISGLLESQPNLKEAAEVGHKWWVLPEDTDPDLLRDISNWRNADQAENQTAHELEILQAVILAGEALSRKGASFLVRDLIASAARQQPLQQVRAMLEILAKFYERTHHAGTPELVHELIQWHSMEINPGEISVSGKFFENLCKDDIWQEVPYLRHYCVVAQYTTEGATHRSAGPSTAALIEVKTIDNLVKTKPQEAKQANTLLKSLRDKYTGALQVAMAISTARIEVSRLCAAIVRTLFGKPLGQDMRWGNISPAGKFINDRLKTIEDAWCVDLQSRTPCADLGISVREAPQDEDTDLDRAVQADQVDGAPRAETTAEDRLWGEWHSRPGWGCGSPAPHVLFLFFLLCFCFFCVVF